MIVRDATGQDLLRMPFDEVEDVLSHYATFRNIRVGVGIGTAGGGGADRPPTFDQN